MTPTRKQFLGTATVALASSPDGSRDGVGTYLAQLGIRSWEGRRHTWRVATPVGVKVRALKHRFLAVAAVHRRGGVTRVLAPHGAGLWARRVHPFSDK